MGIQDKADVELIRHAYVKIKQRNKGIGTLLLRELIRDSTKPILIGTWKAAEWAISFYEKHGFRLVDEEEKNHLLKKYWAISARQIETSVVLWSWAARIFCADMVVAIVTDNSADNATVVLTNSWFIQATQPRQNIREA